MFTDWQGNAADSAKDYFSGFMKTLKDQVTELKSVGRELETMAAGMYETANAIKGMWETLLDQLIAIGLEAAAAAASSWICHLVGAGQRMVAAGGTSYTCPCCQPRSRHPHP